MSINRRQFFSFLEKPAPAAAAGYWVHVHRAAMACRFEVTLPAEDHRGVEVAREALDQIDHLEDQLSVFRDTSEISLINRTAATGLLEVEAGLFDLLLRARGLYQETDGAFDITSTPLTRCWGFFKRRGRIPDPAELEAARARVGMHQVELDPGARTVRFARAGVELNLGSIGKGYALDVVATAMRRRGVGAALLSGGGSSVLAVGPAAVKEGWLVGLRHPRRRDTRWASLRLRDCAMATSGSAEQYFECEGQRYGHIIDPRTGWPAQGVASVTVVTAGAAEADALATAFYVGGPELARRYCASHPEVLALIHLEQDLANPVIVGSNSRSNLEIINA